jgi:hypothetical protein
MTTHGSLWISRAAGILLVLSTGASAQTSPPVAKPLFTEAPDSPFRVGIEPSCVAVGDFNRDGKLDLAIVHRGASKDDGEVTVLLGNRRGGFTKAPGSPFAAGSNSQSVAVGDFNGDGKLDLAITNWGGDVTVLLGDGKGGFTEAQRSPFPVGAMNQYVAVGDFNGDGRADLAFEYMNNTVAVLLGDGKGGFTAAPGSPFAVGATPMSLAVGDFNRDGKLDLAVGHDQSDKVEVLLGDGKGGFTAAPGSPFTVGSGFGSVAVGDFNGDGKLDLAVAAQFDNQVAVLLGDGKGGFTTAPASPFTVPGITFPGFPNRGLAVGDFNGDGKADLAIAGQQSSAVLLNDGKGGFTAAPGSPFAAGILPASVAVGDFNGDDKPDLAIADWRAHYVTVLLNNRPGSAAPASAKPRPDSSAPGNGGALWWAAGLAVVAAGIGAGALAWRRSARNAELRGKATV